MKWLVGTGVSVSSIFYLRNILDKSGWKKVKIVASSGFNPENVYYLLILMHLLML